MNTYDCNDPSTLSPERSSRWSPAPLLKRLWASYVKSCERAYANLPPYSLY